LERVMKERAAKLGQTVIYFFKQNGLQRHQLETGEVVCVCVCVWLLTRVARRTCKSGWEKCPRK
jgi:hypothetical protein